MTHDELLASLTLPLDGSYYEHTQFKRTNALRVVVELAKNTDKKPSDLLDETDKWFMLGWNAAMKETILAIEKELK